jgi:hypothetical protein
MRPDHGLTARDELDAMLEEYRALYQLALFRLHALDQRLPVTVGAVAAALISVHALPPGSQLLVLWATPPALVWLMRTTVNHARSFEDALRRIEVIERSVNRAFGEGVMVFQSMHPSRGKYVGGRTGREAVRTVEGSIVLLLASAGYMMLARLEVVPAMLYISLLCTVAVLIDHQRRRLTRYKYTLQADPPRT